MYTTTFELYWSSEPEGLTRFNFLNYVSFDNQNILFDLKTIVIKVVTLLIS